MSNSPQAYTSQYLNGSGGNLYGVRPTNGSAVRPIQIEANQVQPGAQTFQTFAGSRVTNFTPSSSYQPTLSYYGAAPISEAQVNNPTSRI